MKKIIAVILVCIIGITVSGCQSMARYSGSEGGWEYVPLENTYTPGENVLFDASPVEFEFTDGEGRVERGYAAGADKDFSGDIPVVYLGPLSDAPELDYFRVPYSESYEFSLNSKFSVSAICGGSYVLFRGDEVHRVKWTINTLSAEQTEGTATVRFMQGQDSDYSGPRFTVELEMPGVTGLEASWTETEIRLGGFEGELLLRVTDTQEMLQSEQISVTVRGNCFDLNTEKLGEGVCELEDGAGTQELKLSWSEIG